MSDFNFKFYTGTLSEDYRVFENDGSTVLDYEDFAPILAKADVQEDEEASAVIYEDGGIIYLAVFGLKRNDTLDRAGRKLRFSFCQTFPSEKKNYAIRAFSRVVNEWQETGETVSKLIRELPTTRKDWKGNDKPGEDVSFDYKKFLQWLVSKPANIAPSKNGTMLKYFADTNKFVSIEDEDDSESGYMRWLLVAASVVAIGTLLWMWWPMSSTEQSRLQEQPSSSSEEQSKQPEISSTKPITQITTETEIAKNGYTEISGEPVLESFDDTSSK